MGNVRMAAASALGKCSHWRVERDEGPGRRPRENALETLEKKNEKDKWERKTMPTMLKNASRGLIVRGALCILRNELQARFLIFPSV